MIKILVVMAAVAVLSRLIWNTCDLSELLKRNLRTPLKINCHDALRCVNSFLNLVVSKFRSVLIDRLRIIFLIATSTTSSNRQADRRQQLYSRFVSVH